MNLTRRLAGACGLAFVVLSAVVAVTAPLPPSLTATGSDIVTFYSAHQGGFLVGNYLGAAAFLPAFILIVYLVLLIRDAEPERGRIWVLALLTNAVAFAAAIPVFAVLQATAATAPSAGAQAAKAISDAGNMLLAFSLLPVAASVGTLAWGFLCTRTLSPLIGWAGLVVTLVLVAASVGTIVTSGPLVAGSAVDVVALVAFLAWQLWISVVLLVRPAAPGGRTRT